MPRPASDQSVLYTALPFVGSTAGFLAMFVVIGISIATMMA